MFAELCVHACDSTMRDGCRDIGSTHQIAHATKRGSYPCERRIARRNRKHFAFSVNGCCGVTTMVQRHRLPPSRRPTNRSIALERARVCYVACFAHIRMRRSLDLYGNIIAIDYVPIWWRSGGTTFVGHRWIERVTSTVGGCFGKKV